MVQLESTRQEPVQGEDVLLVFKDALHVRNGSRAVTFLKGADFRTLEPFQFAAVPTITLEVVVEDQLVEPVATPFQGTSMSVAGLAVALPDYEPAMTTSSSTMPPPEYQFSSNDRVLSSNLVSDLTSSQPIYPADEIAQITTEAEQGDADAQPKLGNMYITGNGLALDYKEAMKWFLKAADQGVAQAQANIGLLYYGGHDVPKDYAMAIEWFLKAANQGLASALTDAGNLYSQGQGVPQDYAKAMEWYLKSADQGFLLAMQYIGTLYDNGHGVPKDGEMAMEWYTKAAKQGFADAQDIIGNKYYYGHGITQDYTKALEWYLLAADQGLAQAQSNIGCIYDCGAGVLKDTTKAMEWFLKASDQNHPGAQNLIGSLYCNGYNGVQSSTGKIAAHVNLKVLQETGKSDQDDFWDALERYLKGVKKSHAYAQFCVGKLYLEGKGVS
ncbi:hypothetical protein BGX23_003799 [Mortierella sp. AD031]|nr:hypothetical protein BGX23_003799 [Mortierella sp. AD031]